MSEDDKPEQTSVNDSRTEADSDTRLTRWRSRPVRGCVYFIQADEAIKIGYSISPEMRLGELQVGSHQTLEIIGLMEGTVKTEHEIHEKFDHLRIRGEWFQGTTELLEFIDSVAIRVELPPAPAPPLSAEAQSTIDGLAKTRSANGHETAVGHGCSNLIELIKETPGYERPAWATHEFQTLPGMIKRQMERLAGLKALSN